MQRTTPGSDRPRRSDATRAGILRAAQARFARDGFQRATIRAIAADAGIDPSMVMRYYGNKAGLFAAAIDLDLQLPDLSTIPRARLGETLVAHFLWRWERDGNADDGLLMLLRSAATDESAADRLRTMFADQLTPAVAQLAPPAAGGVGDAAERAGLIATQMLGLALCRSILRLAPLVSLSADEVAVRIGPTIQRYLCGPGQE